MTDPCHMCILQTRIKNDNNNCTCNYFFDKNISYFTLHKKIEFNEFLNRIENSGKIYHIFTVFKSSIQEFIDFVKNTNNGSTLYSLKLYKLKKIYKLINECLFKPDNTLTLKILKSTNYYNDFPALFSPSNCKKAIGSKNKLFFIYDGWSNGNSIDKIYKVLYHLNDILNLNIIILHHLNDIHNELNKYEKSRNERENMEIIFYEQLKFTPSNVNIVTRYDVDKRRFFTSLINPTHITESHTFDEIHVKKLPILFDNKKLYDKYKQLFYECEMIGGEMYHVNKNGLMFCYYKSSYLACTYKCQIDNRPYIVLNERSVGLLLGTLSKNETRIWNNDSLKKNKFSYPLLCSAFYNQIQKEFNFDELIYCTSASNVEGCNMFNPLHEYISKIKYVHLYVN